LVKVFIDEYFDVRRLRSRSYILLISGILAMLLGWLPARSQQIPVLSKQAVRKLWHTGQQVLSISSTTKIQDISFGTFSHGSTGGTVVVSANGTRSATGDVMLIPSGAGSPAIFEVVADTTDLITITIDNVINLTNGTGGTMTVQINDTNPASPFIPSIGMNTIKVGGTLMVGSSSSNPAGVYSGSFEITFIQQ
jgi:hypothetical protein